MEFRIDKDKLKQGLKRIQSIVQAPKSLALSYALLEVVENKLSVKATDAEVYWKETMDCSSTHGGQVCVSAKLVFEIVNNLPPGEVTAHYQQDKNRLNLTIQKSHFELSCLPENNFPLFPEEKSASCLEIPSRELLELLRETSFAINTGAQGMRFHFNGLLLEIHEGKLRGVATNNHRLSMSLAASAAKDFPPSIVPRKAIIALESLLAETPKEKVKILFDPDKEQNKSLTFQVGNVTLITKLISGTFQSLDATIEKVVSKATPVSIDSSVLDEVVKRISRVSNQSHKAVQLEVSTGLLKIEACSSTNDTAKEEMEIDSNLEGRLSLNAQYLLDITRILKGSMKMWIPSCQNDPDMQGLPVVIRGKDRHSTHVVMPLRDK